MPEPIAICGMHAPGGTHALLLLGPAVIAATPAAVPIVAAAGP